MAYRISRYGWLPDLPDKRDTAYAYRSTRRQVPTRVDLRDGMPTVYDQGELGSCTANAIAAAFEFDQRKQGLPVFMPSRLFIYYNERAMEHTTAIDAGAYIRDGFKVMNQLGTCPEEMWPYDSQKYTQQPSPESYQIALANQVTEYKSVGQSRTQIRSCLADGFPVVFGFTVYSSFEDGIGPDGKMPMPKSGEAVMGGHAVIICGYDDKAKRFIVRNSWGTSWGDGGYFYMPYAYATSANLADDFWTMRTVE